MGMVFRGMEVLGTHHHGHFSIPCESGNGSEGTSWECPKMQYKCQSARTGREQRSTLRHAVGAHATLAAADVAHGACPDNSLLIVMPFDVECFIVSFDLAICAAFDSRVLWMRYAL